MSDNPSQTRKIELRCSVTKRQYEHFNAYTTLRFSRSYQLLQLIVLILVVAGFGVWAYTVGDVYYYNILIIAYFSLAIPAVIGYRMTASAISREMLPTADVVVTIDEKGIDDKGSGCRIFVEWISFVRLKKNHDCYYLYFNALNAIVLPISAFSDTDKILFQKMVKEKTGKEL